MVGYRKKRTMCVISILTIMAGAFICVAGLYAIIQSLVKAYATGIISKAFAC